MYSWNETCNSNALLMGGWGWSALFMWVICISLSISLKWLIDGIYMYKWYFYFLCSQFSSFLSIDLIRCAAILFMWVFFLISCLLVQWELSLSLSLSLFHHLLSVSFYFAQTTLLSPYPHFARFWRDPYPKPQMFADINGLLSNASDFLSIPLTFAFAFIRQRKSGLTRAPIWKFGLLFNASPLPSPNLGDSGSGSGLMSFLSTHTGLNYVYMRRKTSCRDW